MTNNHPLDNIGAKKNGVKKMGGWIERVLTEGPFSEEDQFLLRQADLVCLFRVTDEKDMVKRGLLVDQITDEQQNGSEKFGISMIDLRCLIDYIVNLSQEGKLPEFFERVIKKKEELEKERRKQTKKKKKSSKK